MLLNTDKLRALNTAFSGIFKDAFELSLSEYEKIASIVPSTQSSNTYPWVGQTTQMREWVGDRVIQNLKTYDYTLKNISFEDTVGVLKTDIDDDQVGLYKALIADMAHAAKTLPDSRIFGDLLKNGTENTCYDGQYFFDTDHPVGDKSVSNLFNGSKPAWYLMNTSRPIKPFIWQERQKANFVAMDKPDDESVFTKNQLRYGVDLRGNAGYGVWQMCFCSKEELTTENFNKVYASMSSLTAQNGKPLNNRPTLLVVPPVLRSAALEIVTSDKLSSGVSNPNKSIVTVLDTSWLSD